MTVDVGNWLRRLGLKQYEAAFRDNAIDGDVLPTLTGYMAFRVGPRRRLRSRGRRGVHAVSGQGTAIGPDYRNPASHPTGAQARSPLSIWCVRRRLAQHPHD